MTLYPHTLVRVQSAFDGSQTEPVWLLMVREHVSSVARLGWAFTEVASEPVRKGMAADEALVLGRVSGATDAQMPAAPLPKADLQGAH